MIIMRYDKEIKEINNKKIILSFPSHELKTQLNSTIEINYLQQYYVML